jgi:hypothetical protein
MNLLLLPASNPPSMAAVSLARTSGSRPGGARESRCWRSRTGFAPRRVSFESLNDAALYPKDSDGGIKIGGVALPRGGEWRAVANGVTPGACDRSGHRSSLSRFWRRAILGGISRSGGVRNSARCTGITKKDRSCSPCVYVGLPRSGIAHFETGFVATGFSDAAFRSRTRGGGGGGWAGAPCSRDPFHLTD